MNLRHLSLGAFFLFAATLPAAAERAEKEVKTKSKREMSENRGTVIGADRDMRLFFGINFMPSTSLRLLEGVRVDYKLESKMRAFAQLGGGFRTDRFF